MIRCYRSQKISFIAVTKNMIQIKKFDPQVLISRTSFPKLTIGAVMICTLSSCATPVKESV